MLKVVRNVNAFIKAAIIPELSDKLCNVITSCLLGCVIAAVSLTAAADVASVEVHERIAVPVDGIDYERLSGLLHFRFDPDSAHNARIADLKLAPRDADGLVRASAQFMVLRPRTGVSKVALLEVSNRGGQAGLRYFQNGARYTGMPQRADDYGDALLMRRGMTLIWVGWQFDVPCEPGRLRASLPVATRRGEPVTGLVRADWTLTGETKELALGHRDHWTYPVLDTDQATLTYRRSRDAERHVVPASDWAFSGQNASSLFAGSYTRISARQQFIPGVYEMVYRSAHPRVVGLGLAIVRDTMIYALRDRESLFPAQHGIAFGVSQTGRFLRQFLYQGFNKDRDGSRVFDGMLIHSAGAGRGSFNHRFAQPSRDGHQNSAFDYPTDLFPFSSRRQTDPLTGRRDGLLSDYEAGQLPKIMHTNTGYEYWGRAAGLIHTSLYEIDDLPPFANERIYAISSAQHYQEHWPPRAADQIGTARAWRGNPMPFLVNLRALILRLSDWVADDVPPPPNRYPRFENYTLTPVSGLRLPKLPGIARPAPAHRASRADYGPLFESLGIIENQPPVKGADFTTFVAQNDLLGNESGGIVNSWVSVPLATYLSWNNASATTLTDFRGTFVPLRPSRDDDETDSRPAIDELYKDRDDYLARARAAVRLLVADGFVLDQDVSAIMNHHGELWDWVHQN